MNVTKTQLEGVLILEPKVFGDERGFFMESFNQRVFDEAVGHHVEFVQDNHSRSTKGVLRGLHYQLQQPQGKLVRVTRGGACSTWQWISARARRPSGSGWVLSSARATIASYGSRPALRMVS